MRSAPARGGLSGGAVVCRRWEPAGRGALGVKAVSRAPAVGRYATAGLTLVSLTWPDVRLTSPAVRSTSAGRSDARSGQSSAGCPRSHAGRVTVPRAELPRHKESARPPGNGGALSSSPTLGLLASRPSARALKGRGGWSVMMRGVKGRRAGRPARPGATDAISAGQWQRHLGTAEAERDTGFDVLRRRLNVGDLNAADDTGERLHRPGVGDGQVYRHHEAVRHGEGMPGRRVLADVGLPDHRPGTKRAAPAEETTTRPSSLTAALGCSSNSRRHRRSWMTAG